jgi:hypothetical protein
MTDGGHSSGRSSRVATAMSPLSGSTLGPHVGPAPRSRRKVSMHSLRARRSRRSRRRSSVHRCRRRRRRRHRRRGTPRRRRRRRHRRRSRLRSSLRWLAGLVGGVLIALVPTSAWLRLQRGVRFLVSMRAREQRAAPRALSSRSRSPSPVSPPPPRLSPGASPRLGPRKPPGWDGEGAALTGLARAAWLD